MPSKGTKGQGASPSRGTGGRQAWSEGAVGSLSSKEKCHYGVVNFFGGWQEPQKPGVKVLETYRKSRIIPSARESGIPGLGRSWGGDIVEGTLALGTGTD